MSAEQYSSMCTCCNEPHTPDCITISGNNQQFIENLLFSPPPIERNSVTSLKRRASIFSIAEECVHNWKQFEVKKDGVLYQCGLCNEFETRLFNNTYYSRGSFEGKPEEQNVYHNTTESTTGNHHYNVLHPVCNDHGDPVITEENESAIADDTVKKIKTPPNYNNGQVYKITNTVNDIVYVGATTRTLQNRFAQHKYEAKDGSCNTSAISTAMKEIGVDKFNIEHVDWVSSDNKKQLEEYETLWIWNFRTNGMKLYNTFKEGTTSEPSGMEGVCDDPPKKRWRVIVGYKNRHRKITISISYRNRDKSEALEEAKEQRIDYLRSIGQTPVYTELPNKSKLIYSNNEDRMSVSPEPPSAPHNSPIKELPKPDPSGFRSPKIIHVDDESVGDADDELEIEEWSDNSNECAHVWMGLTNEQGEVCLKCCEDREISSDDETCDDITCYG